jgi:ribokinase
MAEVCVVGSFMMDLVLRAPRRPASGETVIGSSFGMFLGGKGFNQAVAAARSGASTAMVGRLGNDEFGRRFVASLQQEGIDASEVRAADGLGTGVGMPLVEDSGENSIVVVPQANHGMQTDDIRAAKRLIQESAVLLLQLELRDDVVLEAATVAHEAGTVVILNPAPAVTGLEEFAGLVDYVIPNEAEASQLTGVACEGEGAAHAARALLAQTKARGVVVTLGSRGVLVAENGTIDLVEGHRVTCVDSVGAGDAFCGGLAASLARGATLTEAAVYGNAAGALAVSRHGAEPSMPTRTEVERLLRSAHSAP